ncbi:MAG: Gldg family protein, partial [Clostridia bacterium]|nr:Gldg family protein [Clostridia bacterium]
ITIKFAVPLDTIKSNSQLFMVYLTADQFSKASKEEDKNDEIPDITVEYFDSYKHPAQFEKYKQLTSSSGWQSSNVIIESTYESDDGEEGSLPLVYALTSFFTTSDGKTVGFNGERRFLLAFLQLAGVEQPVVVFTTGHGEPIGTAPDDSANKYTDFMKMFEDLGFRIKYSDLTREDLDPDCRLIVILDPQRDFIPSELTSLDSNSELDKVADFVSAHGSIMVFLGPTGYEYTNLSHYLAEWGVKVQTTYTIEDSVNTLSSDDRSFSVVYTTEGLGASVQQNYRNLRTKFEHAAPVQILFTERETSSMTVTSSFRTSSSARAYASDTDVLAPADLGRSDGFDLFVVSTKLKYVNNEDYTSYVLTCGCPEMLRYCGSQAFANRGILNVLLTRIPLVKIPVDLDYKSLENYGLTSVTGGAVRGWTVVLAVAMPIVTLGIGTFIVIRRKRH